MGNYRKILLFNGFQWQPLCGTSPIQNAISQIHSTWGISQIPFPWLAYKNHPYDTPVTRSPLPLWGSSRTRHMPGALPNALAKCCSSGWIWLCCHTHCPYTSLTLKLVFIIYLLVTFKGIVLSFLQHWITGHLQGYVFVCQKSQKGLSLNLNWFDLGSGIFLCIVV